MPEEALHSLITDIERKDRQFRTAQVVFMLLIFLGGGIFFAYTYEHNQAQARARAATLLIIEKHNDSEIQKTNEYIQCIAQFFANSNRANLVLTDLEKCNILNNGESVPGVTLTPSSSNLSTGNTQPKSTANPAPAAGSNSTPAPTSNTAPISVASPTPQPPVTVTPPQPVKLLGIPVCVPLLKLCVSN